MIQRYDTTQQKRVDVSQIRRYDGSKWVDVSFVRRYDNNLKKWVDCLNEYEFTSYTHYEPGGAVETISSDGSMVTITVPENNYGGSHFEFESQIPSSAVGNDLTISFTLNASYSGNGTVSGTIGTGVTCRSWGISPIGDYSVSDIGKDKSFSYTEYGGYVEDRVRLTINTIEFGEMNSNGTYTYVVKNVTINGKPCKFNFK